MEKHSEKQTHTTAYEKTQQFNAIVSWLHSYRYKNIIAVFEQFSVSTNKDIIKVVEIGCAHAKIFSILNARFQIDYIGIEIKGKNVAVAKERYQDYPNFRIIHDSAENLLKQITEVIPSPKVEC